MQVIRKIGNFDALERKAEALRAERGFAPAHDAVKRLAHEMADRFASRLPTAKYDDFYGKPLIERVNYALEHGMSRKEFFERLLTRVPTASWGERHEVLDNLALQYLPKRDWLTFLEAGCGALGPGNQPKATANTVDFLRAKGYAVTTVAADWEMPEELNGKAAGRITLAKWDVFSEKFGKNWEFDLIRCTNMLYYYSPEKKEAALSKMKAMLTPGGILLEDSKTGEHTVFTVHRKEADGSTKEVYSGNPYA